MHIQNFSILRKMKPSHKSQAASQVIEPRRRSRLTTQLSLFICDNLAKQTTKLHDVTEPFINI